MFTVTNDGEFVRDPPGPLRKTVNDSEFSTSTSFVMKIVIVLLASPGKNWRVPNAAVKSDLCEAEPSKVP
jgi:hypothetical protein